MAAAALFAAVGCTQGTWLPAAPAGTPGARFGHVLATDGAGARVLLFGGATSGTRTSVGDDLWQWQGGAWSLLPTAVRPGGRSDAAWCRDGSGLLLFGGFRPGLGAFLPSFVWWDTWRLQNDVWTQVATSGPAARQWHAMAASPLGPLLFGGTNVQVSQLFGDTWRWNGTAWQQLAPAATPPARRGHAMALDEARGVVVLHGGRDNGVIANFFADTWEWDGATWAQRITAHAPPPRAEAALAWSPTTQRLVLTGGVGAVWYGDTWTFDGTDWTQLATNGGPPPAQGAPLAFVPGTPSALRHGGLAGTLRSDTWHFVDGAPGLTTFGAGCPDPYAQVPSLSGVPGEAPRLGTTFHFRVANLPATFTLPMLALGLSNQVAAGPPPYTLPFDLGGLGWPGCQQLVSLDALQANASFGTTSDFPLAVPADPALAGFTCHAQAIVLHPGGGVAVSNGLTAVVGG